MSFVEMELLVAQDKYEEAMKALIRQVEVLQMKPIMDPKGAKVIEKELDRLKRTMKRERSLFYAPLKKPGEQSGKAS